MSGVNRGQRALVIGGGMAGLGAAAALARSFARVVVLEADALPSAAAHRRAIPQGHHSHVLMANGRLVFERLLPGLDDDLAAAGAQLVDWGQDCLIYSSAGLVPRFPSRLLTRPCTRPLLESAVLARVRRLPNVEIRESQRVSGLKTDAAGRVSGVSIEGGPDLEGFDLVVDAGGRRSKAIEWLGALGVAAPEESVVNSFLGYATRLYQKPKDAPTDWKGILINSVPPTNPRAAGLWPIEGDRWLVTLAGIAKEHPRSDQEGFLDFARQLQTPIIAELIQKAEPVSPIYTYRRMENRWRHFERLARWPQRFLVLGDGVCGFNPIYGQGMTVAVMEAERLAELLASGTPLDRLGEVFQRSIPGIIADAWVVATGEDSRWPSTEGAERTLSARLTHWYIARLMELTRERPRLVDGFLSVIHMLERPSSLAHPAIAGPVLARALLPRRGGRVEA
ncbi:MAG: FAD-dependent monooxygenase [Myxococcota bacterium]